MKIDRWPENQNTLLASPKYVLMYLTREKYKDFFLKIVITKNLFKGFLTILNLLCALHISILCNSSIFKKRASLYLTLISEILD